MDQTSIVLLIGATAALVAVPGPNVALFVANTLNFGLRYGVATVVGTTLGVGIQLAIVVLGLTAVLQFASQALIWLKWCGVVYLIFLGVLSWRASAVTSDTASLSRKPMVQLFWQGLFLAIANPKTLVFIAAFLPQFVGTDPTLGTLTIAASIYLTVVLLGDLAWVIAAQSLRPAVIRLGQLRHKLTGALLFGSGVGLAITRAGSQN